MRDKIIAIAQGLVETLGAPFAEPKTMKGPNGDGFLLVRDGYRLKRIRPERQRLRRHDYEDLASFAQFLNRNMAGSKCDVLLNGSEAWAIKGPHDADTDIVTCKMVKHPRLVRWMKAGSTFMSQRELLFHVIAANDDFHMIESDKMKMTEGEYLASQLMKFAVAKHSNYQCEVDHHGMIRFHAADEKVTTTAQLPSRFTVHVPIFRGIPDEETGDREKKYDLEVLLQVDARESEPSFKMYYPDLELVMYRALLDAMDFLRGELNDAFLVGFGQPATEVVPEGDSF